MNVKQAVFILGATVCIAVPSLVQPLRPAFAQEDDAGAGAEDVGGKMGGSAKDAGNSNKEKMKAMVQACRKEARGKGLKSQTHEMRQAVADCIVKQKPGMAKVMKCRVAGMDKGLKPGSDELKSFVKDCKKNS